MRKMRLFYEAWMPCFEIHSAVPNKINIVPQSAEIQLFTFRSTLLTKLRMDWKLFCCWVRPKGPKMIRKGLIKEKIIYNNKEYDKVLLTAQKSER